VASLGLRYETKQTYNFTVADTNTYFVGETEALVHNCDCVATKGADDLVGAAGGTVKNAKKGDIRAPGGREKAKELFREFDTKGAGNRKVFREGDGSRAIIGELGDGTPLRLRFKKNGTTRLQAGKQKIQFNDKD